MWDDSPVPETACRDNKTRASQGRLHDERRQKTTLRYACSLVRRQREDVIDGFFYIFIVSYWLIEALVLSTTTRGRVVRIMDNYYYGLQVVDSATI